MGVGEYAELFPLALTHRPISSSTPLGEKVSKEEISRARQASGFKKRGFSGVAGALVPLLAVMRSCTNFCSQVSAVLCCCRSTVN